MPHLLRSLCSIPPSPPSPPSSLPSPPPSPPSQYGMHFDFRLSVPRPKHAVKAVKRAARRLARWIVTLMYPRGLTVTAFFSVAIALLVLNAEPDSWFRTGWVAELAWNIAGYLWWPEMPHTWKLAIVSLHTGFVLSLILAFLEQATLRLLLGQTGWVYLYVRITHYVHRLNDCSILISVIHSYKTPFYFPFPFPFRLCLAVAVSFLFLLPLFKFLKIIK